MLGLCISVLVFAIVFAFLLFTGAPAHLIASLFVGVTFGLAFSTLLMYSATRKD